MEGYMKKGKIDKLGRIVIPINYRRALSLENDTEIYINLKDGEIIITPLKMTCRLCSCNICPNTKFPLCEKCIRKIKEI